MPHTSGQSFLGYPAAEGGYYDDNGQATTPSTFHFSLYGHCPCWYKLAILVDAVSETGNQTPSRRKARYSPEPATSPRHYRSEEHTSELQSLMPNSYAVFCLKK